MVVMLWQVVVLDRLVSGALGQLDEAIDNTKDKALMAAIKLKKKVKRRRPFEGRDMPPSVTT